MHVMRGLSLISEFPLVQRCSDCPHMFRSPKSWVALTAIATTAFGLGAVVLWSGATESYKNFPAFSSIDRGFPPLCTMRVCALPGVLLAISGLRVFAQESVDSYLAAEAPIAKAGLLANIGPSGSKSSGAASGIVIASPNTVNPNYLYSWVRDSSLTFQCIIDQ